MSQPAASHHQFAVRSKGLDVRQPLFAVWRFQARGNRPASKQEFGSVWRLGRH